MINVGPKHGYPRIRAVVGKLIDYVALIRPFTVFAAFMVGYLLTAKFRGFLSPDAIIIGLAFGLSQGFGQVVNQIYDIEIDRLAKPYRPLPSGRITLQEAYAVTVILLAIVAGLAYLVVPPFLPYLLPVLFFAFFYSAWPIRAKKHIWSIVWIAVSRGLLPPLIVIIYLGEFEQLFPVLGLALTAFTWVLAYQVTKDIPDVDADRLFGVKTIPSEHGVGATVIYMYLMTLVYALVVTNAALWLGLTPIMLATVPIGLAIPRTIDRETVTENSLAWTLFYVGLATIYLVWVIA